MRFRFSISYVFFTKIKLLNFTKNLYLSTNLEIYLLFKYGYFYNITFVKNTKKIEGMKTYILKLFVFVMSMVKV